MANDKDQDERTERKLTTILAADFVGYSRLMSEQEEATARRLREARSIIDRIVELHRGRIFNTAGDSVLVDFTSPVEAVRCAIEIQSAMQTLNLNCTPDTQFRLRIGINLGDVVINGDDLLGDAVNVAARLEGICEPGGIVLSGSVYDQITGKLDVHFEYQGKPPLKNITRPVSIYRVVRGEAPAAPGRTVVLGRKNLMALAALAIIAAGGGIVVAMRPPSPTTEGLPFAGRWVGAVSTQPLASADFCMTPERRCRYLEFQFNPASARWEASWGLFESRGPAQVQLKEGTLTLLNQRIRIDLRRDPDGLLRGTMTTSEGQDWIMTMRPDR